MLSSHRPSPHLPPIFEPAVIMEPMTLPCAGQVMQLSVQPEAASSIAAEQPEAVSPVATALRMEEASPAGATATGKRPAAGWGEAESSEAARARPNPLRWRRRLARPDGRCAVRSALYGANHPLPEGVTDILTESSVAALALIREMRTKAAEALKVAMDEDETLQELLRLSPSPSPSNSPKTRPNSNPKPTRCRWSSAPTSQTSSTPTSMRGRWRWPPTTRRRPPRRCGMAAGSGCSTGSGSCSGARSSSPRCARPPIEPWSHPVQCYLSLTVAGRILSRTRTLTRYPDLVAGTGFVEGTTQEVVLAGGADSRVVRLAMLHDDDGCPDHFDVLSETSPPASPSTSPRASPPPLPLRALANAVQPVYKPMPSPSC